MNDKKLANKNGVALLFIILFAWFTFTIYWFDKSRFSFTTVFFLVEIQIDFRSGKFQTCWRKIFQTFSSHAGSSEIAFCIECVFKATLSLWADVMKAIFLILSVGTLSSQHLALTYEFWGAAWSVERAAICIRILEKEKKFTYSAGIFLVRWTKCLRQTRIASRLVTFAKALSFRRFAKGHDLFISAIKKWSRKKSGGSRHDEPESITIDIAFVYRIFKKKNEKSK